MMDRREALKRIAALSGGALSATTISGVLAGCGTRRATPQAVASFTQEQQRLLDALVEVIIPTTETPGARDAGVVGFIDDVVTHVMEPEDSQAFLAGLGELEERAQARYGSRFVDLAADQQGAAVRDLAANPSAERSQSGQTFFAQVRELTIAGYYTSEVGGTREHRLEMSFPDYESVPFDRVGTTWSSHQW